MQHRCVVHVHPEAKLLLVGQIHDLRFLERALRSTSDAPQARSERITQIREQVVDAVQQERIDLLLNSVTHE